MPLDLFEQDADAQLTRALQATRTELPAAFGESTRAAVNEGFLFGQSIAQLNARTAAVADHADEITKLTGDTSLHAAISTGGVEAYNKRLQALGVDPLTEDEIAKRALARSTTARAENVAMKGREQTAGSTMGQMAGGAVAGMADPVNVLTFPLAAPRALGVMATAATWAGIAGGTQTAIEALGMPFRLQVDPTYGEGEAAGNVLSATAFGGLVGGGIKGAANTWTRLKTGSWPSLPRTVKDAGNVVASEANVATTNPFPGVQGEAVHRTAMQKAIDNWVAGRPIGVEAPEGPITAPILTTFNERTYTVMEARQRAALAEHEAATLERTGGRLPETAERLSEQQLAGLRTTALAQQAEAATVRTGIAGEQASVASGRAALAERTPGIEAMRADVTKITDEANAARERLAAARPPTDEATQARLDAIAADQAKPNLSAAAKAQLEAERQSIVATLDKTAPGDARLIGSLQQEIKALDKTLARSQKALAKAEAKLAKDESSIASREGALPGKLKAAEARIGSRGEVMLEETRKAVSRLANEGYGIRIPRDDAQAIAQRILGASDQDIEAVLKDVTETMVSRKVAALAAQPQPALPFGTPNPRAQKIAENAYWVEETRKRITALAREVGYEMPRAEADAVAAHIARLPEDKALAVLDELMLRPRTIAEFPPGTRLVDPNYGKNSAWEQWIRDLEPTPPAPRPSPMAGENPVISEELPPGALQSLAQNLTDKEVRAGRADPKTQEAVVQDLDRARATGKKMQMPVESIGANGEKVTTMRNVEDVMDEIDARIAAAKEIAACASPQEGAS